MSTPSDLPATASFRRAVVIGAGTMGAAIAAHFANAGLAVTLLDLAPTTLTPDEAAAGRSLDDPAVRRRVVETGFRRMLAARPAHLFTDTLASSIRLGVLEDDLETAVAEADWIVEAIVEQLAPKQALMAQLEALAPAHAVITTNTSGLPIHAIATGRDAGFQRRFLGAHFFNPPRYLQLVELIPTPATDPALTAQLRAFIEEGLGKDVVLCKDTPNFIANRLVSVILADLVNFAVTHGYTVEEVDALAGPLLGRPRSGVFRLHDVVGIDVWALIADNLYPLIPHDAERAVLLAPAYRAVLSTLIRHGHLGAKSGQGFYKSVTTERGREFWALDLQVAAERGEVVYLPPQSPSWPRVEAVRRLPLGQRLAALVHAPDAEQDPAASLIRHTLFQTLAYAAQRIPEIADDLPSIDRALVWGYGWELGPFALWDALGVAPTAAAMQRAGFTLAPWVAEFLAQGYTSFYHEHDGTAQVYAPQARRPLPLEQNPQVTTVAAQKRNRPLVATNEAADLVELGDGVLLLEFHSKLNTLDTTLFPILDAALERLHGNARGLLIANDGVHFCAGANLRWMLQAAEEGDWNAISTLIGGGQARFMALRRVPKPVVAAPFQRVLGGGVEVCFAAHRVVAHAESYLGLVEVNVGLIPGWGGCKELVRRHVRAEDPLPGLTRVFDLISGAVVSASAPDAQRLGLLTSRDQVVMHRGRLLHQALRAVHELATAARDESRDVFAAGDAGLAQLHAHLDARVQDGRLSSHDALICRELAAVLCGGGGAARTVDEQTLLDLEHEAFLRLIGHPASQARMRHMLAEGKPLRN